MRLSDFHIGLEFWFCDRQWRCTDVGTRTVVAIRIDEVSITTIAEGATSTRRLSRIEAEQEGSFAGPPYTVLETVFDEYDLEGCVLTRDEL